jgi:hypothetical protein
MNFHCPATVEQQIRSSERFSNKAGTRRNNRMGLVERISDPKQPESIRKAAYLFLLLISISL